MNHNRSVSVSRFTKRQTTMALLVAGLAFSPLAAVAADHYVSINPGGGTQRPNYDNDGATGAYSTAIGTWSEASGIADTAVGSRSNASGGGSVAIGAATTASGTSSVALGNQSIAQQTSDTALGRKAEATGGSSTAVGSLAKASGLSSLSAGDAAVASGQRSVALGQGSTAAQNSAVALGSGSSTSAVVKTSRATVNGISYGGFAGSNPGATVSVGNDNYQRTITNVGAGRITADSTDAINGSQLYQVADQVGTNAENIATNTSNIATNTSNIATNTSNIATNTTNITNNTNAINNINTQINDYGDQITNINNRVDSMGKDLRAGIAGATAIAFLQRPNEAGKSMVSMAVGGYRGEQALAIGYARNADNNKWSTKVGVGVNTQKHVNWGGSVGYQW